MDVKDAGKRIVVAGIFMLAAAALTGCASDNPAAPPAAAPPTASSKLGTIEANVTYCTAPASRTLDLYYPTQAPAGLYPVVVYIHGGQLIQGQQGRVAPGRRRPCGDQTLTPQGYVFVSINYRLGPA